MDEFNNMYNSFYMNYDTPELSEEAQRRIATIVTQVQHNNYHEEEEQVLSSVLLHHETYFTKQPCMDSNYTGQMWVDEVLNGHDDRCMNSFRMPKNIFHSLLHDSQTNYGLKHGKVSAMEKLALSLYILGNKESNSNAAERFQRSGETVSRIFTDMLHIFARMGIDTIKPIEGQFEEVPNHIRHDTRYWPHFKDCIGAIDGTHIKACISPSCQIPYIGRKGEPTQNIMAVCDFNMCFIFAFPGWEGTAHDSRIFLQALRKQQLKFPHPPPGKYYLVDSGYPQMAGFLGPYRGERYHLPDFHRVLSVEGRLLKSLSKNDSNQVLPPPTPTKTSDFGDSIEGYKEDFRPTTPGSSPGVGHSFAEDVEDIAERNPASISVQGNGNRSIAGHSPGVGHAYPNGSQNSEPNA
ncbi:hypothetical protein J1N35_006853 [Gossypium stocksii]|uniref:DDE Tnp4 domain-containing protein n=1 Tax=Gossypium stocksii TaxID=47602 RepID=A0A9D4AF07_9ROSI|nr:hypothetical protein J1N35_006853 [Gossypium stocksii]